MVFNGGGKHDSQRGGFVLRSAKLALSVVLALGLSMPLSACKDTDVLTETIIDQSAAYVDESLDPIREDNVDGTNDEYNSMQESESDRQTDQDNNKPQYGDNSDNDNQTDQRQNDNVDPNYNASEGNEPSGSAQGDGEGDGDSATTPQNPDDSDTENPGDSKDPSDAQNPSKGDDATGPGGADNVYGQNGTYTELPENTNGVAATGLYATIVQMLAGKGGLVASDSETLASLRGTAAFPGEGLESVTAAWSGGEGSRSLDLTKLVRSGAKVVLTSENDQTIYTGDDATDAQTLAYLQSNGISVVVMPTIGEIDTPDAYISQGVAVVAELLRDVNTQYDAVSKSATWKQLHDGALNWLVSQNGGYAQITFANGGNLGSYFIYQKGSTVFGEPTTQGYTAQINVAYADSLISSPVASGVISRSFGDTHAYLDGEYCVFPSLLACGLRASGYYSTYSEQLTFPLFGYYLQCAGAQNSGNGIHSGESSLKTSSSLNVLGAGDTQDGALNKSIVQAGMGGFTDQLVFCLSATYDDVAPYCIVGDLSGSAGWLKFPGIFARNSEIAQTIKSSADLTNGYYNLGYSYYIWVVPSSSATGSWVDGTTESFLSALYVYGAVQKGNDFSECTTYLNQYCEALYRCGSADVINDYGAVLEAECPTS